MRPAHDVTLPRSNSANTLSGKFRVSPSSIRAPSVTPREDRLHAHLHSTTHTNLTMFAARTVARAAPRQALARAPVRAPARAGRRNYSSESPKQFAGAEDNEFNRERAHIAQHAAESGELWRKLSLL
jgi:hypothetical protein